MSPEAKSQLDIVLGSIDKKYGKGTVVHLNDKCVITPEDVIPTGSIQLDLALGIGGYRKGRIVELFGGESAGKSTLAHHACANTQKQGREAAYIDQEHTFDPIYSARIGTNLDRLIISQPDCAEQALDIVDMLSRSGDVGLIVIDSVAALVPQKELEGDMGDQVIGLQARLMSQAMRKLVSQCDKTKCTLLFINQIRYKIGGYGCFHYDTLVNFEDGRSIPIGKVVDEKISGNVYCINNDTGEIEIKPIIDWHDNGSVEKNTDFIHVQTNSIDSNSGGRFGFTCTLNHKVLTDDGWKEAQDLSYQDKLISKYLCTFNGSYGDFIRGILVGDSDIWIRSENTASLKMQDNENFDYINWKLDKISPFMRMIEKENYKGLRYYSDHTYELAKEKKLLGNRDPMYLLNNYSSLGMAVWIMDDGHLDLENYHKRYQLSIKRFKNNKDKLDEIKNKLISLGFQCNYNLRNGLFTFTAAATELIADSISKYVPQCMQYKLPEEFKNRYEEFKLSNCPKLKTDLVDIKEIRYASERQMRNKRKFDISIEGNHNYMVGGIRNGIIVHNSPETTSGGAALAFYASQRIHIAKGTAAECDEFRNRAKCKVVKNKCAPPKKTAEFDIVFGKGIDREMELFELAIGDGILTKAGSWIKYNGESVAQGEEKALEWLNENPEIKAKIYSDVLSLRGLE